jgi:hypothetical protein
MDTPCLDALMPPKPDGYRMLESESTSPQSPHPLHEAPNRFIWTLPR